MTTVTLRGDAALEVVDREIANHGQGVLDHLAPFDAANTIAIWHETIRAAEEFINVPLCVLDDDELAYRLMSLPMGDGLVANPNAAIAARNMLTPLLGADAASRFMITMLRLTRADVGLRTSGRCLAGGFVLDSVAAGVAFLQSRRRHFVSLLYAMVDACRGDRRVEPEHAYDKFLPLIEYCCDGVTGWSWKKIQLLALPNFSLTLDEKGAMASQAFNPLGAMFLEPERVSIVDMLEHRREQIGAFRREPQGRRAIFSAAELRNNLRLIEAGFIHFDVADDAFGVLKRFTTLFSRHCRDDYYVELPATTFEAALASQSTIPIDELRRLLVNPSGSYADCSNGYEPFLRVGDRLISNVVLLSRFANMFKNLHLASRRRFLTHAGFIFEDMVEADLLAAGFTVTGIKRINHKEFDVVTTLGDVIHNFQCKNNWIDLSKVERNPRLYARYNRSLVRYYRRALTKEHGRETLLTDALGRQTIRHYVVSRFAVITDDPAIINFNQLPDRAAAIVVGGRQQDSDR
jgi:hypothetical protein